MTPADQILEDAVWRVYGEKRANGVSPAMARATTMKLLCEVLAAFIAQSARNDRRTVEAFLLDVNARINEETYQEAGFAPPRRPTVPMRRAAR